MYVNSFIFKMGVKHHFTIHYVNTPVQIIINLMTGLNTTCLQEKTNTNYDFNIQK